MRRLRPPQIHRREVLLFTLHNPGSNRGFYFNHSYTLKVTQKYQIHRIFKIFIHKYKERLTMKSNNYITKLSIQGLCGIPMENYTDENLNIIINNSIHRFHALATHIPDLPEEFALVLAEYDEGISKFKNTLLVAWMHSTPQEAYLYSTNYPIIIYDLKVISILRQGEFEEEKIYSSEENEPMIWNILVKNSTALN